MIHRLARPALVLALLSLGGRAFAQAGEGDGAWPVTRGAAAGYVPDEACADCHAALWDSYQEVAMAKAFRRPRVEDMIEDLEHAHYYHEASGNHYEMVVRGDDIFQRRYRLDSEGKPYAVLERKVDWIVGSGNHGRNYFFRTELGEMFQLPLVWYSQDAKWGMAPGYDKPDHFDFGRQIGRRCMSCHDAYPDVPEGSDAFGKHSLFPPDLPEGIGCQRCHGPGAEHVRLAEEGEASDEDVAAAIVNPADLPPLEREDLCNQCHLQPSTSIDSFIPRAGVPSYAFRPGMRLEDHHIPLTIDEGTADTERFEINHHAYRLAMSRCYRESNGALTCLTCHDPHRKVPAERRAEYYRAKCLECHGPDVCSKNPMHVARADVEPDDCVACHMPMHRPREVVNVLMTDHRIRRDTAPEDWTAPRPERGLTVRRSELYRPERLAGDPDAELYAAIAATKSGDPGAIERLKLVLESSEGGTVEAWLALGDALFGVEANAEAVEAYRRGTELAPELAFAHGKLGSALARTGRLDESLASFERALELEPDLPENLLNSALVLVRLGRVDEAIERLEHTRKLRPHQFEPQLELANLYVRKGDWKHAIAGFRAARRADPRVPSAHDNLGLALRLRGRWSAALRAWELGLDCAPDDLSLTRHLAELRLVATHGDLRSPERALELARHAVELDPDDATSALLLALAELETGAAEESLAAARRAGELGADAACWRLVEARAELRLGRTREARESQALATGGAAHTDPVHDYIRRAYGELPD